MLASFISGWFTPAILFLLLNIVIATIVIISSYSSSTSRPARAIERLRSFNLQRFNIQEPQKTEEENNEQLHHHQHLERSQSDATPADEEKTEELPFRALKKSASEKSAFKNLKSPEIENDAGDEVTGEVDARADDFINRFRQQLKLQRLESFMRYKEMITKSYQ